MLSISSSKENPEVQKIVLFENYNGRRKKIIISSSYCFSWHAFVSFFPLFFSSLVELFLFFHFVIHFSSLFPPFFQQFLGGCLGTAAVWDRVKWELNKFLPEESLWVSDKPGTRTHMPKGDHLFHYLLIWNYYQRTKPTTCQLQRMQLKYMNKHTYIYIYIYQKVNFASMFLKCRAGFLICVCFLHV